MEELHRATVDTWTVGNASLLEDARERLMVVVGRRSGVHVRSRLKKTLLSVEIITQVVKLQHIKHNTPVRCCVWSRHRNSRDVLILCTHKWFQRKFFAELFERWRCVTEGFESVVLSDVVAHRVTIVEELTATLALAHVIRARNKRHHCLLAIRRLLYCCSPTKCMKQYTEH